MQGNESPVPQLVQLLPPAYALNGVDPRPAGQLQSKAWNGDEARWRKAAGSRDMQGPGSKSAGPDAACRQCDSSCWDGATPKPRIGIAACTATIATHQLPVIVAMSFWLLPRFCAYRSYVLPPHEKVSGLDVDGGKPARVGDCQLGVEGVDSRLVLPAAEPGIDGTQGKARQRVNWKARVALSQRGHHLAARARRST